MPYVDAHAHVADAQFADDIDDVITRATKSDVSTIIAVSTTTKDAALTMAIHERFPKVVVPCAGLHPVQPSNRSVSLAMDWKEMEEFIGANISRLRGIGEVGLDYSPHVLPSASEAVQREPAKENQKQVLLRHAELAVRHQLALNVHSRSAGKPTIELLHQSEYGKALANCGVLLHAFDGGPPAIRAGIEAGFYFSIPACVVRLPDLQKHIARGTIPLDRMLLESDAPALAPVKGPGQRNEPANVVLAAAEVARLLNISVEQVGKVTSANAAKLFRF